MGVRYRSATPGTLICLGSAVLLALVSFNTPLIKSMYFLSATFSSGTFEGTLHLGTLGYCLTDSGNTNCVGPTVGYEFNPNTLFGISRFDIPETVTKYLTYTLILHIIALAFAVASVIFGLLSHISSLSVLCFPTCTASITSSISLIALIFDLVIFYISKKRIDAVSGASATIGISVWLTLAAWILAGVGGCAYGVGRCCMGRRSNRESGDYKRDRATEQDRSDDMRLQAIRDEQVRKKEQGLPSFQEMERTPLRDDEGEDKYLYEEQPEQRMPGALQRDGSVLQGVGVGYGRRNPRGQVIGQQQQYPGGWVPPEGYGSYDNLAPIPPARRPSAGSGTTAGNAGYGAGGRGVENAAPQVYGGYYGNPQRNYHDGYSDPYQQQQQQSDPYQHQQQYNDQYQHQQQYNDPYQQQTQAYDHAQNPTQHHYPPQNNGMPMPVPTPAPRGYDTYGPMSSDSHYPDPGPQVTQADPYDGYDDGLGAIGMAATSSQGHERDYTGATFGYPGGHPETGTTQPIHVPTPQHLVNRSASNLLRSPMSPASDVGGQRHDIVGARGGYDYRDDEEEPNLPPPSYGAVSGSSGYQAPANEKNEYR